MVYVAQSKGRGRGMFASRAIGKGEMIENSQVIKFPTSDSEHIEKTKVGEYWFNFGHGFGAIGLGNVSLYNHSSSNNAQFLLLTAEDSIIISAIEDIEEGEEIFINYRNTDKFKELN